MEIEEFEVKYSLNLADWKKRKVYRLTLEVGDRALTLSITSKDIALSMLLLGVEERHDFLLGLLQEAEKGGGEFLLKVLDRHLYVTVSERSNHTMMHLS